MKRIFKYQLPRDGETITITACVVKWLDIKTQDGWPHIWAIIDDEGNPKDHVIAAWGTGWPFPDNMTTHRYMGTAIDVLGYVWHYFMEEEVFVTGTTITDYDYSHVLQDLLSTGTPVVPNTVTISCGDPYGLTTVSDSVSTIRATTTTNARA